MIQMKEIINKMLVKKQNMILCPIQLKARHYTLMSRIILLNDIVMIMKKKTIKMEIIKVSTKMKVNVLPLLTLYHKMTIAKRKTKKYLNSLPVFYNINSDQTTT